MSDKITKSDRFAEIRDLMTANGNAELADFAQKEIDSLAAKAAKAKENAAKKAAETDELEAAVASELTSEFQTGAGIWAIVGDDAEGGYSLGKVRARLNKLVKAGSAVKDEITITEGEKSRKAMAYKLAE